MSETIVTETLSGAVFTDAQGDTVNLSGTWTTYYDAAGEIENGPHGGGISDEVLQLVATGTAGTTTFTSAYAPGDGTLTADAGGHLDGYELTDNGASNGIYNSLYLDYTTEHPDSLAVALGGGFHSSIKLGTVEYDLTTPGVVTCFTAGTAIATPAGPAAIETLAAGDLVSLHGGGAAPIRWIGRRAVATKFADPINVLPVRIRAGALGDHLPLRDLLVSPCHALLVEELLVQAGAFVNGVSITQETAMPDVFTYYHIELADHSLILAEGVAAETFVDNVDRMAFDNWAEHEAPHAGAAPIVEMEYPRARSHRQVPAALRRKLAVRANAMTETARAA